MRGAYGLVAMAALKNRKMKEQELDRLAGTRLTLETQVSRATHGHIGLDPILREPLFSLAPSTVLPDGIR